jgi:hypothetical protein
MGTNDMPRPSIHLPKSGGAQIADLPAQLAQLRGRRDNRLDVAA